MEDYRFCDTCSDNPDFISISTCSNVLEKGYLSQCSQKKDPTHGDFTFRRHLKHPYLTPRSAAAVKVHRQQPTLRIGNERIINGPLQSVHLRHGQRIWDPDHPWPHLSTPVQGTCLPYSCTLRPFHPSQPNFPRSACIETSSQRRKQ